MSIVNLSIDPFEAPYSLLMPFGYTFLLKILLFLILDGIWWHFVISEFLVFEYHQFSIVLGFHPTGPFNLLWLSGGVCFNLVTSI